MPHSEAVIQTDLNDGDSITSPTGRHLGLVGNRNTTHTSDQHPKQIRVAEKYVILDITTETTGYTLQKLYGHPNVSSAWNKVSMHQPATVVPTYRAVVTLYDSSKGVADSDRRELNVTRDAHYYLGPGERGKVRCRNIAFEPLNPSKNVYLTEEIHFPSAAHEDVRGFFLLEEESQRGKTPRWLHAKYVSNKNAYGTDIPLRTDGTLASNVMFHIGGFYEASMRFAHARWLGGSEGCFAFIPQKTVRTLEAEAGQMTLENAFFSNRTWVEWTAIIKRYRNSDPQKRFFVRITPRPDFQRDVQKDIVFLSAALDPTARMRIDQIALPGLFHKT